MFHRGVAGILRPLTISVAAATAFDPTTAIGPLVFSNSNTTITHPGVNSENDGVWTVSGTTLNQKVYIETLWTNWAFQIIFGFSNDKTAGVRFGGASVSPSKGWVINSGSLICFDSIDQGTAILSPAPAHGDFVDFAFDTQALKGWCRNNNGAWNTGRAGTQDPATGQGGFATTITGGGPYFFFYGSDGASVDNSTTTFASGSWARSAPSGFTQLAA